MTVPEAAAMSDNVCPDCRRPSGPLYVGCAAPDHPFQLRAVGDCHRATVARAERAGLERDALQARVDAGLAECWSYSPMPEDAEDVPVGIAHAISWSAGASYANETVQRVRKALEGK